MKKLYNTAELCIVRISAQDIIATSATLNSNSAGLELGNSWDNFDSGSGRTAIGYGED